MWVGEDMGRRRRNSAFDQVIKGGIFVLVVVAAGPAFIAELAREHPWLLFWSAFGLVLLAWCWILFWRRSRCDVETKQGTPCDNNARGYLRACHLRRHQDIKWRALAARIGFRAWANRARRVWTDRASVPSPLNPPVAGTSEETGKLCRSSYEAVSLACAVSSSALGFVSTIVTVVTFVQSF